jgi:hypothetical protein
VGTRNDVEEHVEESQPENAKKGGNFMSVNRSKALRPFVIITSSDLLFTITDGAIRLVVLLHAYDKSFSALQAAIMFCLYELAGVFTNLAAGLMGAKWGIKSTLIVGLSLQVMSYGLMFGWQDSATKAQAMIYVTGKFNICHERIYMLEYKIFETQLVVSSSFDIHVCDTVARMFAGIAKDLTKLGGKTVRMLVTPDEKETQLFKLVSFIIGWKYSLKGVGYIAGAALLQVSYELALSVMIGLVLLAMPWAIFGLDRSLGMAKTKNATWKDAFKMDNKNLNLLSAARLFLFASRDFWFEVPLPFCLRAPSCEGLGTETCYQSLDCSKGAICGSSGYCENVNPGSGCGGLGLERVIVGAVLGGYIILYGRFQFLTPQLVTGPLQQS